MTKESKSSYETFFDNKWRPAASWVYLVICVFDFLIFPLLFTGTQLAFGAAITQWEPLTIKGAGIIHVAFGAILGVSAWGRTKEKLNSNRHSHRHDDSYDSDGDDFPRDYRR